MTAVPEFRPVASRPPATIGRRIAGYVLDQLPLLVAGGVVVALVADRLRAGALDSAVVPLGVYAVAGTVYGLALWWWLATAGLSPGKRLLGLRVVSARTGRPIGWGPAFLRQLVLALVVGCTLGVGGLVLAAVAARDPRRRGWHDRAAGSLVIDELAAVAPPPAFARSTPSPTPGIVPVELPAAAGASAVADVPVRPVAGPQETPPVHRPSAVAPVSGLPPSARGPAPSAPPPRSAGGLISAVPGLVDDVPGIGPPAPGVPAPAVEDDDPELTRMPARPDAAPGTWTLDVGGRPLTVRGTGLLGRDPQPRAGEDVVHLVPVDDPQRSLSKTHLQFGVDAEGFWVRDRGSTNGTAVRTADGVRHGCPPGSPVRVAPGSTLLIGDQEVLVSRVWPGMSPIR